MRGRLIAFEGIDGSGKSTQVAKLAQHLNSDATFQFGATQIGAKIREILLTASHLDDRAEALLIIADKAQHITEVVQPALAAGRNVISDRFCASTVAYQGYGRGLDLKMLNEMLSFAVQDIRPDLTVLLDLPVSQAMNRISVSRDRFESNGREFFNRVRKGYLELASQNPSSWLTIDASKNVDEVAATVVAEVEQWLATNK